MTRWIATAIAAIALLLAATIVVIAIFGVTIDVSRWRAAAATRLSAALGRTVVLEGPLELSIGRAAILRFGGARILNPPDFAAPELATIGEGRAQFDVIDALRGRLHFEHLDATDIHLRLERTADGRANWVLPLTDAPARRSDASFPRVAVEVGDITLRKLAIDYSDARTARRHFFQVDELSSHGRLGEPLRLALRGRVAGGTPYAVRVEGGTARLLQDASAPWPFTLDFEYLDTRFHAAGAVDTDQREARFEFGAGTADAAQIERLLDTKLPRFGPAALAGNAVATNDTIELADLRGVLGKSELSGHLTFDRGGARPRIAGALTLATLDLHPFLGAELTLGDAPLDDHAAMQDVSLRDLVPLDLDLDLNVAHWLGLPGDLRDARLELNADARGLRVPITATFAGVPFSGRADLDTAAPSPLLAVELDAKEAALGDLAQSLKNATGIAGTLGALGLRLSGRGETLGALARDLELTLAVARARLRYGRLADGRPITFTLDTLDITSRRGERLQGRARGTLFGERATLALRGGTLPEILHERATPIEADLTAGHTRLRVDGTLAHGGAAQRTETDVKFNLGARRAGDLARWLPIAPDAKLPLAVRGRLRTERDAWRLDDATVKLGRSTLTANVRRTSIDGHEMTVAAVRSPLIDVPELATLRAKANRSIDAPPLPAGIALADADIDLRLDRVALGRVDLVDFALPAKVREGRLLPSPIAATLAGTPIAGRVALDLRGVVPDARIDLSTGAIDIGVLLRRLGLAKGIDGRADALDVALHAQGSTLREIAQRTSFEGHVTGGSIAVRGAAGEGTVAEIGVREAVAAVPPGGRLRVLVDGTLDGTLLSIDAATGTLSDFAHGAARVPLAVTANAGTTHLTLEGEIDLPPGRGGQLAMEMGGERLDALNAFARVELPPWGPWSMRGPIRITPTGYAVRDLVVSAGASRLKGTGELDLSGPRPRLDVRVTATDIQLDDFPLPERLTEDAPQTLTAESVRATTRALARRTERLMSVGFLRRLDAHIDVVVKQVYSGTDRLADGALRVQVNDGRLHLGPALVNLPGGTLRLSIAYDPTAPVVDFKAGAYIERFDYGILARRLHQAEGVRGLFSARVELAGQAPSLDQIMRYADGQIDFAVWPEDVPGGLFNLWSVNLLLAVLPVIDPGGESHVNCIVGRFDLDDGIVSDDKMLIDTTRVRVRGAGSANLRTETLDFVFRPRAKGLALFRLQNPLRVTGTLTDYRIGIDRRDLPESILRMLASPIIVPWERLTLGPLPRDGADVCTDPLRE